VFRESSEVSCSTRGREEVARPAFGGRERLRVGLREVPIEERFLEGVPRLRARSAVVGARTPPADAPERATEASGTRSLSPPCPMVRTPLRLSFVEAMGHLAEARIVAEDRTVHPCSGLPGKDPPAVEFPAVRWGER